MKKENSPSGTQPECLNFIAQLAVWIREWVLQESSHNSEGSDDDGGRVARGISGRVVVFRGGAAVLAALDVEAEAVLGLSSEKGRSKAVQIVNAVLAEAEASGVDGAAVVLAAFDGLIVVLDQFLGGDKTAWRTEALSFKLVASAGCSRECFTDGVVLAFSQCKVLASVRCGIAIETGSAGSEHASFGDSRLAKLVLLGSERCHAAATNAGGSVPVDSAFIITCAGGIQKSNLSAHSVEAEQVSVAFACCCAVVAGLETLANCGVDVAQSASAFLIS